MVLPKILVLARTNPGAARARARAAHRKLGGERELARREGNGLAIEALVLMRATLGKGRVRATMFQAEGM